MFSSVFPAGSTQWGQGAPRNAQRGRRRHDFRSAHRSLRPFEGCRSTPALEIRSIARCDPRAVTEACGLGVGLRPSLSSCSRRLGEGWGEERLLCDGRKEMNFITFDGELIEAVLERLTLLHTPWREVRWHITILHTKRSSTPQVDGTQGLTTSLSAGINSQHVAC